MILVPQACVINQPKPTNQAYMFFEHDAPPLSFAPPPLLSSRFPCRPPLSSPCFQPPFLAAATRGDRAAPDMRRAGMGLQQRCGCDAWGCGCGGAWGWGCVSTWVPSSPHRPSPVVRRAWTGMHDGAWGCSSQQGCGGQQWCFFFVKWASPPVLDPAVMAQLITVYPNLMDLRTDGDIVFDLTVMRYSVVVYVHL